MKLVNLLSSAIVAGAVRYPIEGPLIVTDDEAAHLVEQKQAEIIEAPADDESADKRSKKAGGQAA